MWFQSVAPLYCTYGSTNVVLPNFSPYFDNEAPKVQTLSATIDLTIDITKSFLTNRIIYLVIPINIARAIKMADVNAVFVR